MDSNYEIQTFLIGHFLTECCISFPALDISKMFLVSDRISVKGQPETKLYGEEAQGTLQLPSALRHTSHRGKVQAWQCTSGSGADISWKFSQFYHCRHSLCLTVFLIDKAKLKTKMSKKMGENSKLSAMEFLYVCCVLSVLMTVRIFFNLFHLQSGPNKLEERRKVGSV